MASLWISIHPELLSCGTSSKQDSGFCPFCTLCLPFALFVLLWSHCGPCSDARLMHPDAPWCPFRVQLIPLAPLMCLFCLLRALSQIESSHSATCTLHSSKHSAFDEVRQSISKSHITAKLKWIDVYFTSSCVVFFCLAGPSVRNMQYWLCRFCLDQIVLLH